MNDLLNTSLFSLLAESSQEVASEEMQNAYGHFVEQVEAVGSSDDNTTVLRTLNITRIELVALESFHRYEQGEKCPEICLSAKSYCSY
ncbi:hypothetical protein [Dysgonomonas sp.]